MLIEKVPLGTMAYLGAPFQVPDDFCWAWSQMVQFNNEYVCSPDQYIHLSRSVTTDRSTSRNILRKSFFGDWLLMVDADQIFQPDLLLRMVMLFEAKDLDVLVGVYNAKVFPYSPMIQWKDEESAIGENKWRLITGWKPDVKLLQIGRSGGGCLMVRRRVFDRITEELGEEPFAYKDGYGEDYSFFARVEKLGIKAFAAAQVHLGHLVIRNVSMKNFVPQEIFQVSVNNNPVVFVEDSVPDDGNSMLDADY